MSSAYYGYDSEMEMSTSQQNANERVLSTCSEDEGADLIYPTHSRWGAKEKYPVLTTRTYPKTLELFRAKLPAVYSDFYDTVVAGMSKSQKTHLEQTVRGWSDDQFELLTEGSMDLVSYEFGAGIRILAGEHAYLKAKKYESDFNSPETKKQIESERAGHEESSQDWKMLQSRIHALPPELFRMVKDWTLGGVFLADVEAKLNSRPLKARKCIREQLNIGLLSQLDRASYQAYKDRILVENLYTLSSGGMTTGNTNATTHPQHICQFFAQIPTAQRSKISRLKVCFTQQDYFYLEPIKKAKLEGFCDEWLLFMLQPYLEGRGIPFHMLCDSWIGKADFLTYIVDPDFPMALPLKELILDFNDAWGPDGVFFGARIAMYLPILEKELVIVEAPTLEAAEKIRRILVDYKYRVDVISKREEYGQFHPSIYPD